MELTPKDFDGSKLKSKECTAVLFYAPWCGHCQHLKPEWKQLEEAVGFMDVASLDCDKFGEFIEEFNKNNKNLVRGYPTIVFFKNGKPVQTYSGNRVAKDILEGCMDACSKNE